MPQHRKRSSQDPNTRLTTGLAALMAMPGSYSFCAWHCRPLWGKVRRRTVWKWVVRVSTCHDLSKSDFLTLGLWSPFNLEYHKLKQTRTWLWGRQSIFLECLWKGSNFGLAKEQTEGSFTFLFQKEALRLGNFPACWIAL